MSVTPFPSRPIRPRSYDPDEPRNDDYAHEAEVDAFEPYYASEMEGQDLEPRRWLIDGVAERGTVLLFAGATKIGKSLLMQQLMTCSALGQPWLGIEVERVKSLALYAEDPQSEIKRRQARINSYFGCSPADYELDLAWQSLASNVTPHLTRFDRQNRPVLTPLFHQAKAFTKEKGVQLVGLDNARTLFGGNEVYTNQVVPFVRHLVQWAIEIDGVIVLAAHPGKNDPKGFAGTGAWLSSVRAGVSLRRPDDFEEEKHGMHDPRRVFAGIGSNYGPGMRTQRIDWDDGVFVISDREERDRPRQGPLSSDERRDCRYQILMSLRQFIYNGGQVFADITHNKSLPALVKRSPTRELNRVMVADVEFMQKEMLDAGQIERVDVGGKCLLRPCDGPAYKNEQPWLMLNRTPLAAD